jgi:tRNA dimethylallyltransferase
MLSATSWATKAADEIKAAVNQGRQVIVTGGTGFYLKALVEGLADIPAVPVEVRAATQELLKSIGDRSI